MDVCACECVGGGEGGARRLHAYVCRDEWKRSPLIVKRLITVKGVVSLRGRDEKSRRGAMTLTYTVDACCGCGCVCLHKCMHAVGARVWLCAQGNFVLLAPETH